uniref:Putative microtubule associated complex n=1 Tax=Corethrella appendiculata TaxID=1370023 RepID=U5EIK3_9DIPT
MGNIVLGTRSLDTINDIEISGEDLLNGVEDEENEDVSEHAEIFNEQHVMQILRQLINSGEIQIVNEQYYSMSLPTIRKKPTLDALKVSTIFQDTKQASGFSASGVPNSKWSILKMIANRQNGYRASGFPQHEKCKINNLYIPNRSERVVLNCDSKIFCGTMSKNGKYFITAGQDEKIRILDATTPNYNLSNEISAKNISWAIVDIDISPCGEYFVYSTWSDALYISKLFYSKSPDDVQPLYLNPDVERFCAFAVAFSNCGKQILAGANDGCLYSYDRQTNRRTLKVQVSESKSDVNAVGFLDETSQIFFSGIDNGNIKVWDCRCLNEARPQAAGVLVGHFDGITYIDSRNDGRYIISNSKDQSIKLWDLRIFSPSNAEAGPKPAYWDYRWDSVPKRFYNPNKSIEGDTSVMTYRGHRIQKSLIRAKFSPALTTGQRYIYTGCGTGRLIIYDVLTGKIVQAIEGHRDIVRDVAWHPHRSEILTSSWDFQVKLNTYDGNFEKKSSSKRISFNDEDFSDEGSPPLRRSRRIAQQRRAQNLD